MNSFPKLVLILLSINVLATCNYNIGPREILEEKPEEKPTKEIKNLRIYNYRMLLNGEIYDLNYPYNNDYPYEDNNHDVLKLTTLEREGAFIDIGMRFGNNIALDSNGKMWIQNQDLIYIPTDEVPDSIFLSIAAGYFSGYFYGSIERQKLILITSDSRIFVEEQVSNDDSFVDYHNTPLKSACYNEFSICGKDADSYLYCWNFPLGDLPSFRSEEKVTDIIISGSYLCYLKETGFVTCHSIAEDGKIDYREFSLNNQQEPFTQITFRTGYIEGMVQVLGLTESGDIKFWDHQDDQAYFGVQGKKMIRIEEYPYNYWYYSIDENGTVFVNDHILGESEPLEIDMAGSSSGFE
jgi:hypothetical protein